MKPLRRPLPFAFAASLLIAPALAQQTPNRNAASAPAMSGMAAPVSPADHALTAGMAKMNEAMSAAPMTGNPDRDFVSMMVPHHQGAIDMAQVELRYGKDPILRRMAEDIVAAQQKEIAEMRRWQAKHR